MTRPFGMPVEPDLTTPIADAIQTYWFQGLDDPDMADWLATQDAAEVASALAVAIGAALNARFVIRERPFTGGGPR